MKNHAFPAPIARFITIAIVSTALGLLTACGGDDPAPPPAPPAIVGSIGYFEGSAAISVPSGTDLAIASPDFKAMLDNSRLVIVSEANDLVYSASVTQRTVDNFTASVRIYKNGVYVRSATITGVDNTVSKTVSGTFSGTGDYASGTFSLTYNSTINARAPLVFADTNNRYDAPPIASVIYFTSNTTADIEL